MGASRKCGSCCLTANYGHDKKLYCAKHKLPGMKILGKIKTCELCHKKTPSYALPGHKPTHCKGCSTTGMEMTKRAQMCEGCGLYRGHYGRQNEPARFCRECATADMCDVVHAMCQVCGVLRPSYRISGQSATHCAGCATEGMLAPVYPRCSAEGCDTVVSGRYRLCTIHDPDRKARSRVRETKVAGYLETTDLPPCTSRDKRIPGAKRDVCGAYRPDFVWLLPQHVVVLEVDELQHAGPGYTCENRRMLDIWNSYGGLPLIIIRFNPDAYKKGGVSKCTRLGRRLPLLSDLLKDCLKQPPSRLFTVHRVYYDTDKYEAIQSWAVTGMEQGLFTETLL